MQARISKVCFFVFIERVLFFLWLRLSWPPPKSFSLPFSLPCQAQVIRGLLAPDKFVIVVEHDLSGGAPPEQMRKKAEQMLKKPEQMRKKPEQMRKMPEQMLEQPFVSSPA